MLFILISLLELKLRCAQQSLLCVCGAVEKYLGPQLGSDVWIVCPPVYLGIDAQTLDGEELEDCLAQSMDVISVNDQDYKDKLRVHYAESFRRRQSMAFVVYA